MPDDTIAVRPDEALEVGPIHEFIAGRLPGSNAALNIRQFGGGAANLTYLLDYSSHKYVLRRPPLGPIAPGSHDMSREYRVLSVLNQAFPAAPSAFLFSDNLDIVGAPFFIMERRQGIVVRREIPDAFLAFPNATGRMSAALVDALADLHAVDYKAIGLAELGRPDGFIQRQVDGWARRWAQAKSADLGAMDTVQAWLQANIPPNRAAALVHNDFKLDNVMLDPADPGRILAIFDWDMCTLGDPLVDLGALLTYWTSPDDPEFMQAIAATFMPAGAAGFMTRAELVECYHLRSGRSVDHIRFYHVLGLYRVAVIIAQIYIRFVRGQTQDKRFAKYGRIIPLMAQSAAELILEY